MRKLSLLLVGLLLLSVGCGSKTKEALYAEGVKQLDASNPSGAVIYFKNALEKDGNFDDARLQLAKAYAALEKLDQAEKELSKVLKQNPSRDEVTLELAKVLNREGKGEEAFRLGEQYRSRHPQDPEALEVLGVASLARKTYQDAENYLLEAMKLAPQRSQVKVGLASVYTATGRNAEAKELLYQAAQSDPKNLKSLYMLGGLERSTGNADKAAAAFRRIIELRSSETLAQYKLGLIQIEKGELGAAQAAADEMIKKFPHRGDGYRLKGMVSYHRKNFADAIPAFQTSLKSAPTYEGYYFLGLSFYHQGELESALSQFRRILDRIPDARQARLMTAQVLLKQQRFDDAVAEARKALDKDAADAVAHDILGTAYLAQGLFNEGLRELDRATEIDPKMVSAHMKKGYYLLKKGKESEGESELASAVNADPGQLNNRLLLASHYQGHKKGAKAAALLRAGLTGGKDDAPLYNALAAVEFASNNRTGGINNLEKAKQVDPSFQASYENLANFYAASGDYPRAIAEYGSLLRRYPTSLKAMLALAALYDVTGKESEAMAQYQKATETKQPASFLALAGYLQKKGQTEKALRALDEAAKLDPKAITPLEMKGRLLAAGKQYREALKVFDQVEALNQEAGVALKLRTYVAMQDGAKAVEQGRKLIAKSPRSAKGYLVLASVYQGLNDIASAMKEARNAISVEPKSVEARVYLGNLLEKARDYGKAMSLYQEALKLNPASVEARFASAGLLERTGKKREAAKAYRSILTTTDSFSPALNNLAYLCADGEGSKEEALRLAISAFKLEPGNPAVMDTVGYALLKNGRNSEAVKVLERAVSLLPNEPSVRYHLALAYKLSGDKVKAQQTLQKSVSMGNGPDANAARGLLAELKR
jgi:putative PEP-CTERM system TPR-repeat lipoprotein